MNDRKLSVGGDATGNFNLGDDATLGDVNVVRADNSATRQELLTQLASLRAAVAEHPEALTRIDDLEEEVTAAEPDPKGGQKALARLKTALAGVASVTGVLATIEDQVRSLFS